MAIDSTPDLDLSFHALADSTRRQIIERLSSTPELSAGDLVSCFNSAQPTISKHLRVLEKSGLVSRKVIGRNHMFSLNQRSLVAVENWFERHRSIWNNSLDNLAVMLDKQKSR